MSAPLIIIGSGFAAYQLVKTLRRKNSDIRIQLFTLDEGEDYNKPDLSHVFTRQQMADDLIATTADEFIKRYEVDLFTNTAVERIDPKAQIIMTKDGSFPYSKLVLATGAHPFLPNLTGDATHQIVTLNSLQEYRKFEQRIHTAQRILIMGGGIIGTELAMDLSACGKQVQIVEPSDHLMANLIPNFIADALEHQLRHLGVNIECRDAITSVNHRNNELMITSRKGNTFNADCIIAAAGIVPNTELAKAAGAMINRGIIVDNQLKTSLNNVYALGDCAEVYGKVMPFLQPIILSANTLANALMSTPSVLSLPAMMVKVKTPQYPIQIGGNHTVDSHWQVDFSTQGIMAKAFDNQQNMTGFVVTKEHVNQAFALLKEVQLNTPNQQSTSGE